MQMAMDQNMQNTIQKRIIKIYISDIAILFVYRKYQYVVILTLIEEMAVVEQSGWSTLVFSLITPSGSTFVSPSR